jgi:hypothetical protein
VSSDRREFLQRAATITAGLGIGALPATAQQLPVAMPTSRTVEGSNMASPTDFIPGGYRFIPAQFQYSAGVAALPGHEIQRITFRKLVPLKEGFRRVEQIITEAGRPLTALCACELRSPAPFTQEGFRAFNEIYVVTLGKWGIYNGSINPVARSNVCPEISPPAEPSFHAFSFTTKVEGARPSFVNSGGGSAIEGKSIKIIRPGDTSADGLREKAHYVLGQMERRMAALGFNWSDATAVQVYTVYDLYPFLADEIVRRGAAGPGLTPHFCRPPVRDVDYEMDCRSVWVERVI